MQLGKQVGGLDAEVTKQEPRIEQCTDRHEEPDREGVTQRQGVLCDLMAHIRFTDDDASEERSKGKRDTEELSGAQVTPRATARIARVKSSHWCARTPERLARWSASVICRQIDLPATRAIR